MPREVSCFWKIKMKLVTSQGIVYIPIEQYKGFGLSLSGGIDSASLLYCMLEYMHKNSINRPFYCVTTLNRSDPTAAYHAQLVLNFVKRRFPIEVEHIIVSSMLRGGNKISLANNIFKKLVNEGKIDCIISGVTANPKDNFQFVPPAKQYVKPMNHRDDDQWTIKEENNLTRLQPYAKIDKRAICEITEQKNIKEKLLMITKSCTDEVKYECLECWWCQERAWGFNYKKSIPGRRWRYK